MASAALKNSASACLGDRIGLRRRIGWHFDIVSFQTYKYIFFFYHAKLPGMSSKPSHGEGDTASWLASALFIYCIYFIPTAPADSVCVHYAHRRTEMHKNKKQENK